MKLRLGFVSNSSSSSCVLIGRPIGNPFTEKLKLEEGKEYVMIGGDLWDGVDLIRVDQKIVDFLCGKNAANWDSSTEVIEVYDTFLDAYAEPISPTRAGSYLWGFVVDQHSTEGLEEFRRRYPEIEEDNK